MLDLIRILDIIYEEPQNYMLKSLYLEQVKLTFDFKSLKANIKSTIGKIYG